MVLLTAASQFTVSPKMENLKKEMVSVQNTPETDPRRLEFNKLHHRSVFFEGTVLLVGLAGMFLLGSRNDRPVKAAHFSSLVGDRWRNG